MSGCQKAALLVLVGAVVLVFWVLFQLVQSATGVAEATPTSLVLHTPTSTATGAPTVAGTPASSATPVLSSTPLPEDTATSTSTSTLEPTAAPTNTPIPPTSTPQPSPTHTATPTTVPRPTVPAEVSTYLKDFTSMVSAVHEMGLLESAASADQDTAEQLRAVYRQLHEMAVPKGAEEMHLAFVTAVSVLEEKCLCQVFAEAHGSDAQGQHYRDCVTAATTTASEVFSGRFIPARDAFLQQHSLTAKQAGFPG